MGRSRGMTFARRVLSRLSRDRRGVGGVEFALVAPLLIMAYIGAFELSVGLNVVRKVARASSTVADLVSQEKNVDTAYLDGMSNVAESVLAPYAGTDYTLKITGIQVNGTTTGTVLWSRDQDGGTPYPANSTTTVPADLEAVNAFVVRTELVVPHELLLFSPDLSSSVSTIDLSKTTYYRQRSGTKIECSGC
ncbi:pilus assembly protein contains TadE domain [Sinorhizobium americanum]|uniref:Pilus assembly protein contains TadE domain n=2 Tax=Sinorhizobium americanum TaxID=194963 RepID=A0A1L3LHB5_9HYPH|nr:pilus assembly protein contains TadE domain [Sinorhizobium americanum]